MSTATNAKATKKSAKATKAATKGAMEALADMVALHPCMTGKYQVKIFEDILGMTPFATKTDPPKAGAQAIGVAAMATECRKLAMAGPNTYTLRLGVKSLDQLRLQCDRQGVFHKVALPSKWSEQLGAKDGPVIVVQEGTKKADTAAVDAAAVDSLAAAISS